MDQNVVCMTGRLGADPELKKTANGISVVSVSLANSMGKDKETNWQNLVFWKGNADNICTYCKKGTGIWVEGKSVNRKYEGKDGYKKTVNEIIVSSWGFTTSKRESNESDITRPYSNEKEEGISYTSEEQTSEELPF